MTGGTHTALFDCCCTGTCRGSTPGAAEAPKAKRRRTAGMRNIIMNTSERWLVLGRRTRRLVVVVVVVVGGR